MWKNLRNMLNEFIEVLKNKCFMFSFMCGSMIWIIHYDHSYLHSALWFPLGSSNMSLSQHPDHVFFIGYFIYLHIKCYLLSLLLLHKSAIPSHLSLLLWSCSPNHMSTPSSFLCILLCWVIEPSQDHEPPLPLIADKVILGYICSWSHESLHMSSLFGGLVPGSSGDSDPINNIKWWTHV